MKLRSLFGLMLVLSLVLGLSVQAMAFSEDEPIAVVSREEGSGTRGAFIELTGIATKDDQGREVDNTSLEADFVNGTNLVMTTVAGNEAAIGYASLASVEGNDSVRAVRVNDVEATVDNILNSSYAIARPFNLVTTASLSDPVALDFYAFVMSKEGQDVVSHNSLVSVANDQTKPYAASGLEGRVYVGGSTSVTPIMEKLKEAYEALNPHVKVDIQSTGSSAGVTNALSGTYQIGMASRELKESELAQGAISTVLAMDGICVIVNQANPIENLSLEQVRQIFVGDILTWAELSQ